MAKELRDYALRRKRSSIWMFFSPMEDRNIARCGVCRNVYSIRGGSTSNLRLHIRTKHPSLLSQTRAKMKRTPIGSSSTSDAADTAHTRPVNGGKYVKRGRPLRPEMQSRGAAQLRSPVLPVQSLPSFTLSLIHISEPTRPY